MHSSALAAPVEVVVVPEIHQVFRNEKTAAVIRPPATRFPERMIVLSRVPADRAGPGRGPVDIRVTLGGPAKRLGRISS